MSERIDGMRQTFSVFPSFCRLRFGDLRSWDGKTDACLEARLALSIKLRTAYLRNFVNPARSSACLQVVGLSGRTTVTWLILRVLDDRAYVGRLSHLLGCPRYSPFLHGLSFLPVVALVPGVLPLPAYFSPPTRPLLPFLPPLIASTHHNHLRRASFLAVWSPSAAATSAASMPTALF